MSNLRYQDDDFPEAAGKHLDDSAALLAAGRFDGAGYLAGYVVECSLKSLVMVEELGGTVGPTAPHTAYEKARKFKHDVAKLSSEAIRLATLGSAVTARYLSLLSPPQKLTNGWRPELRYAEPGRLTQADAEAWLAEAGASYVSTVQAMLIDGVITR
jgi:hypothetical protein